MEEYSFVRYLSAKKSVDDRALNRHVWQILRENINLQIAHSQLMVLEIGAGIGTMLERMLEWGLFSACKAETIYYRGIDLQEENIIRARQRIMDWAGRHGWRAEISGRQIILLRTDLRLQVDLQAIDLFEFLDQQTDMDVNLLVAHAFLDLVELSSTMPRLLGLLGPGGLFYFTINYDGMTIFEPSLDTELEERILSLYHQSMDERLVDGKRSGDSQSGRHMYYYIKKAGADLLASGASDWVVSALKNHYQGDEAYFLRFILYTIEQQLDGHPGLEANRFAWWIAERRKQIERGELVYIAHQLDFCGRIN